MRFEPRVRCKGLAGARFRLRAQYGIVLLDSSLLVKFWPCSLFPLSSCQSHQVNVDDNQQVFEFLLISSVYLSIWFSDCHCQVFSFLPFWVLHCWFLAEEDAMVYKIQSLSYAAWLKHNQMFKVKFAFLQIWKNKTSTKTPSWIFDQIILPTIWKLFKIRPPKSPTTVNYLHPVFASMSLCTVSKREAASTSSILPFFIPFPISLSLRLNISIPSGEKRE